MSRFRFGAPEKTRGKGYFSDRLLGRSKKSGDRSQETEVRRPRSPQRGRGFFFGLLSYIENLWGGVMGGRARSTSIHDSLSRLRRPVGRFDTELPGVLRVQSLPAAELHRLASGPTMRPMGIPQSRRSRISKQMCRPAAPACRHRKLRVPTGYRGHPSCTQALLERTGGADVHRHSSRGPPAPTGLPSY
jgi:hypothetical protein